MSQRFFVETAITSDRAELVESEAHHLLHVMRASIGDEVVLFDGSGAEFPARVAQLKRSTASLEILARQAIDRELPFDITLGVALPKGDRQKWLIEKTTEMGVRRIVPLSTRRGVAQPEAAAIERLRRSVIEASKQCGRNRLMEIAVPQAVNDFLSQAPANAMRLIAHPEEETIPGEPEGVSPRTSSTIRGLTPSGSPGMRLDYYVAIGPEGGFADEEVQQAFAQGWRPFSLGPRILRVETAAVAIAAALSIFPLAVAINETKA